MNSTVPKDSAHNSSFLDQTQLEGKASGEVKMDLDQALDEVSKILSDKELQAFGAKKDEDWDSIRFAVYCHDCHDIVPAGVGKARGKMRTVCGTCNSRKIASGREEALRKYYNLEEKSEDKSSKDLKSS